MRRRKHEAKHCRNLRTLLGKKLEVFALAVHQEVYQSAHLIYFKLQKSDSKVGSQPSVSAQPELRFRAKILPKREIYLFEFFFVFGITVLRQQRYRDFQDKRIVHSKKALEKNVSNPLR